MTRKDISTLVLAALGGVVLLGVLVVHVVRDLRDAAPSRAPEAAPVRETNVPPERRIRLANRTIELAPGWREFPKAFAQLQAPSARRTVSFVVMSELPVSKDVRARVSACGARVIGFIPANALVVEAGEKALRRLADDPLLAAAYELAPGDKVQSRVREKAAQAATVDVTVVPLMATDVPLLGAFVKEKGGAVIPEADGREVLRARVPAAVVDALTGRGDVRWIEAYAPARLQADVAVGPRLMNVRTVWEAHGLTGRGQILSTADSGLDTGDLLTVMADFQGRLLGFHDVPCCDEDGVPTGERTSRADFLGHGTHTAGLLVGTGALSDGQVKGVAHGAHLEVTGLVDDFGVLHIPSLADLFRPPRARFPASIHSASWGDDEDFGYGAWSRELDAYVWSHPDFLPVFSCGNQGDCGATSVTVPATAKNCLAVGATGTIRPEDTSPNSVVYFSSRGPTEDGRVKPDVCAPGYYILSTRSTQAEGYDGWDAYLRNPLYALRDNYVHDGGTSMACPLVAGSAALVREWLVDRRGFTNAPPTAALLKAVLTGGARDMSAAAGADCGGAAPNNSQGWGRVDLGEALYPSNRAVKVVDRIPFAQGSDYVLRVETTCAAPLDVQLVWIDPPAEPGAAAALVNDLDLVVSNETDGAVFSVNGLKGGRDAVNNLEGVRVASAAPGVYCIRVKGVRVPYASDEGGAAALYVRGAFDAEPESVDAEAPEAPWCVLRLRTEFPELPDWGRAEAFLHPSGSVVRVQVPDDLPDGAERLTGMVWTDDETGRVMPLGEQRLAEISVAAGAAESGTRWLDAAGRMPTALDVAMDGPKEVRFRYFAASNAVAGVPGWWTRRYLSGVSAAAAAPDADADGDGLSNADEFRADTDPVDPASDFRILSFTPAGLVWRGGRERTQVVERAGGLGPDAVWTPVYTNFPPTPPVCELPLPPGAARDNSFYRIRAF